jgi:peptide/nickel transport system permease protein
MFVAGTFLLLMSVMLLVANLVADLVLAWLDPRIVYA